MWHASRPAPEQCEGCTWVASHIRELAYIRQRDAALAVFAQGPYEETAKYRDFTGWKMPWYSAAAALNMLLIGRRISMMHVVCYLRRGSEVFDTYWTTRRDVEAMDSSYRMLDLTFYGRRSVRSAT